jgi:hypothetical protein
MPGSKPGGICDAAAFSAGMPRIGAADAMPTFANPFERLREAFRDGEEGARGELQCDLAQADSRYK